jgi:hypothetical protein
VKKQFLIPAIIALAAVAGVGCAVLRIIAFSDKAFLKVGPWRTSAAIGSENAGPELRAMVAVVGLLALTRDEAAYFVATDDSSGAPLSGDCRYRIEGHDLASRWWSLTAYGLDRFLIPNPGHRYSVSSAAVSRDEQGQFTIRLAATAQEGDWIFVAPGHRFMLDLRAYNPSPALNAHPAAAGLPTIIREGCS